MGSHLGGRTAGWGLDGVAQMDGEQLDTQGLWGGGTSGWGSSAGWEAHLEKVPHCPHANIWVKWGVGLILNPTPNGICMAGVFCPIPQLDDPIQQLDHPGSVASSRASGSGFPHGAGERGWGCSGERSRGGGSTFTTH